MEKRQLRSEHAKYIIYFKLYDELLIATSDDPNFVISQDKQLKYILLSIDMPCYTF